MSKPTRTIRLLRPVALAMACALSCLALGALAAPTTALNISPPDLGSMPPDIGISVVPNVVVTIDDSDSMERNYMGDDPPYGSSWSGPWRCAAAVDDGIVLNDNPAVSSWPMNGVYYNPGVTYVSPKLEDNSDMLEDSTLYQSLTAVPVDGIAVHRPADGNRLPAAATATYGNNPNWNVGSTVATTNLMGTVGTVETVYRCTSQQASGTYCSTDGEPYAVKTRSTDKRWTCGYDSTSPMDGAKHVLSDGATYQFGPAGTQTITNCELGGSSRCCPINTGCTTKGYYYTVVTAANAGGGPYYYRLKKGVSIALDAKKTGKPSSAGVRTLYNKDNWEAVPVQPDNGWGAATPAYKNFSLWYAFYRTRSQMARTVMSRVFGPIGSPSSGTIRVAWQNVDTSNWNASGSHGRLVLGSTPIQSLDDSTSYVQTNASGKAQSTVGFRHAFFNWIYNVGASGLTPIPDALDRVGKFYSSAGTAMDCTGSKSCSAPSTAATQAADPYWQDGQEVACRQNYHVLITDGFWSGSGNGGNTVSATTILPDLVVYNPNDPVAKVFSSMQSGRGAVSNIAFDYWSRNLRPDLVKYSNDGTMATNPLTGAPYSHVPALIQDTTTGITAAQVASVNASAPPGRDVTPEVYFNPANDPATWPHMVNFMVSLGATGKLDATSSMPDCTVVGADGVAGSDYDYCQLRKNLVNSSGAAGWPSVSDEGTIDDLWHAAINSRGDFFIATDPSTLIDRLRGIFGEMQAHAGYGQSTATSVSGSILTSNAYAYVGGYDSTNWSGMLYADTLDTNGNPLAAKWDAGCILSRGLFTPDSRDSGPSGTCSVPSSMPNASGRNIYTSVTRGGSLVAVDFSKTNLSGTPEIGWLNLGPNSTWQTTTDNQVTIDGVPDGNASDRIDYLAGKRDYEGKPSASGMSFRARGSLLGPIVNSQAVYLGGPGALWQDIYPAGSPEQSAASSATCEATPTSTDCHSYESYLHNNSARAPRLYVGANDGMLHAFDAASGEEAWAYVPNALYASGQLTELTNASNRTLVPTVDATPIVQDVFLADGAWHTVLVGSLRLGGRAIYALDVTDPNANGANKKFLWEFDSGKDDSCAYCLGYTYSSANIARLHNGKWVVLVASGYFPAQLPIRQNGSHSIADTTAASTANVTHLWVLDINDGSIIRRLDTPGNVVSFGLSTPDLVDFNADQIDDIAVAGDLAGNLWRFDLSDPDPTQWKVDHLFQTYPSGTTTLCNPGASSPVTTGIGCEPISTMPVAFADPTTGTVVYVFGTGKYLGDSDRTKTPTTQHFFGVRDYGTGSANYPITPNQLVAQTLREANGMRSLTASPVPGTKRGWSIAMPAVGERAVISAVPQFASGAAILTSLLPSAADPCSAGRSGAVMMVDAVSGGPPSTMQATPGASTTVGMRIGPPPLSGAPSILVQIGGGQLLLPGLGKEGGSGNNNGSANGNAPAFLGTIWRRNAWRELPGNP